MDWTTENLRCPACRGKFKNDESKLICESCQTHYPVLFGVPLLSEGVVVAKRPTRPIPVFVDEMARFLGTENERARKDIDDCFALDLKFGDPVLQTEAEQFLNRLRSSGVPMPEPFESAPPPSPPPPASASPRSFWNIFKRAATHRRDIDEGGNVPSGLRLAWLVTPASVIPKEIFTISVVVFNGSGRTISSDGEPPLMLSYWWEQAGTKIEGHRTPLLIDLSAGRQISMPIIVQAPNEPGEYTLKVMPIIEGVAWMPAVAIVADIAVRASGNDPLAVEWKPDPGSRGVAEDHNRAVELCRNWMRELVSSEVPKVLELGGNFNPMAKGLYGERYNADIDAFGLMTYNIREAAATSDNPVRNIVANGTMLPFDDKSLDVIMMFATFHHFPDPVELLTHLRSKLKDDGIICLMCEPIGHVFRETGAHEFIGELERGVYEQSFMPWEYREMLAAAGLTAVRAALDTGSLKLAAKKIA